MPNRWNKRLALIAALGLALFALGWSGGGAQDATPVAVQVSPMAMPSGVLVSVREGTCGDPDGDVAASKEVVLRSLAEPGLGTPQPAAAPSAGGTSLAVPLTALVPRPHVVEVRRSVPNATDPGACGEIAGPVGNGGVVVPLVEGGGSAPVGVAWLGENGDGTTTLALVLFGGSTPCPPGRGGTPVVGGLSPDLILDAQVAASGLDLELELTIDSLDVDLNSSLFDLVVALDGLDLQLGLASDILCLDADAITGLPLLPGGTPAATPAS